MNDNKGLTLIEVLITMALISIVFTIIFSFFYMHLKSYNIQQTTVNLSLDSDQVIMHLSTHLKFCKEIQLIDGIEVNNNRLHINTISFIDCNNKVNRYRIEDGKLYFNQVVVSNYIKEIIIKLIPKDTSIQLAKGVHLNILFNDKNIRRNEIIEISFRNK